MQITIEPSYLVSFAAGVLAMISAIYLLNLWRTQENRLLTDLPLFFGVSFTLIGVNMVVMSFMNMGLIPNTMEVFRLRTLFLISGSVLPLLIAILFIWFPRHTRYFKRVFAAVALYWSLSALFAPTEQAVMILLVPVMLAVIFAVVLTFIITWKTGRLQEVRSDLIVFSGILISVGQVGKIIFASLGLVFLADLFTASGIIFGALGLSNPWYRRSQRKEQAMRTDSGAIY